MAGTNSYIAEIMVNSTHNKLATMVHHVGLIIITPKGVRHGGKI